MLSFRRAPAHLYYVIALLVLFGTLGSATGVAAQTVPGGEWSPAAGAQGNNTYEGFIDQPTNGANLAGGASFVVSGWVVDTTAQGWSGIDDVQVMLGSTSLAHLAIGLSRPDVAGTMNNPFFASSGFSGSVPGTIPAGSQTLTVVAHTPDKGSWSKNVTVNVGGGGSGNVVTQSTGIVVRIISPTPDDIIPANNNGTIFGTAYDTRTRPELGSGVDRVSGYLDAPRGTAGSQTLGDAVINGPNWSLAWEPTKFDSVRHHILYIYAHSAVTGEELLVTQEINITSL
jgi:hypothetical protein